MDQVTATLHRTTNEIPFDPAKQEVLKPLAGVPPIVISITEPRKIHRDAYLSFLVSAFSIPSMDAGRDAQVRVEEGGLHILMGNIEVVAQPCSPLKQENITGQGPLFRSAWPRDETFT